MHEYAAIAATTVAYLAMEVLWFSWSGTRVYAPLITRVQGAPPRYRLAYALPAYAALVAALWVFVVRPARGDRKRAAALATLLALAVYVVYNASNLATLFGWGLTEALIDTAWGVAVLNATAQLALTLTAAARR